VADSDEDFSADESDFRPSDENSSSSSSSSSDSDGAIDLISYRKNGHNLVGMLSIKQCKSDRPISSSAKPRQKQYIFVYKSL